MSYYLQCTVHLDSIPASVADDMQFDRNIYDQWICSRILDAPLSIPPIVPAVSSAPLIFQMTGMINNVVRRRYLADGRMSVSFWLTSPIDTVSRVFWSRIPSSLRTIAAAAERPVDYCDFFGIDRNAHLCRIKIVWDVELDEEVCHISLFSLFANVNACRINRETNFLRLLMAKTLASMS